MSDVILGFVGAGFVGGAMIRAFSGYFPTVVYDKGLGLGSLEEVSKADVIFLSLPSPEEEDGSCDTSIVDGVLKQLNTVYSADVRVDTTPVVIRSTLPPEFFYSAQQRYKRLNIVFMPEFLTARTADLDFIMSSRFIIGVSDVNEPTDGDNLVLEVFDRRFPRTRKVFMTWEEASLVKYGTNNFFCVKISFFNELFDVCERLDVDPKIVIEEIMNDGRIGRSHFQVPGPDGKRGWGGACFPKDSAAFVAFSGGSLMVEAAREVNETVRDDE